LKKYGLTKCLCCNYQEIRQIEFYCGPLRGEERLESGAFSDCHVILEKNGGKTNLDNLRPICTQCNLSMGIMNMLEFKKIFYKIKSNLIIIQYHLNKL
jgi:5-methylcytosine-specific restriction endonuclease McrA